MVEQYLTATMIDGIGLKVGKRPMLKTYSFTTDDDEQKPISPPKLILPDRPFSTEPKTNKSIVQPSSHRRKFFVVVVLLCLLVGSVWVTFNPSKEESVVTNSSSSSLSTRVKPPSVIRISPNEFLSKLRRELKIRSRRSRTFLLRLSKITGVKKETLFRFLRRKDLRSLTLTTFLSLLDFFHLMILIVPK